MNQSAREMFAKHEADEDTRMSLGVGVVVRDDAGRVLMEKRADCGLWGLPGGKLVPGETLAETAHREVLEETGLKIRLRKLVGVYSEPYHRIITYLDNGDVVHLVDVILEAEIISGELTISHESEELAFFEPGEIPAELAPPAIKPMADVAAGRTGMLQ